MSLLNNNNKRLQTNITNIVQYINIYILHEIN